MGLPTAAKRGEVTGTILLAMAAFLALLGALTISACTYESNAAVENNGEIQSAVGSHVVSLGNVSKELVLACEVDYLREARVFVAQGGLVSANVRVGKAVQAGESLGTVDDRELQTRLRAMNSRRKYLEEEQRTAASMYQIRRKKSALELEVGTRQARYLAEKIRKAESLYTKGKLSSDALEEVRRNTERQRGLNAITSLELNAMAEEQETREADREAQLDKLRLERRSLEERIESGRLRSPLKGTVVEVSDKVRQAEDVDAPVYMATGEQLCTVAEDAKLGVTALLDEADVSDVKPGDTIAVLQNSRQKGGHATVQAVEYGAFKGRQGFVLRARLDDTVGWLIKGSALCSVATHKRKNVVVLPLRFIRKAEGGYVVCVQSSAGTPVRRAVELGVNDYAVGEIRSGLKVGDTVLICKE
jgi:hypothetical protein